jgi:hypothetical protein
MMKLPLFFIRVILLAGICRAGDPLPACGQLQHMLSVSRPGKMQLQLFQIQQMDQRYPNWIATQVKGSGSQRL